MPGGDRTGPEEWVPVQEEEQDIAQAMMNPDI